MADPQPFGSGTPLSDQCIPRSMFETPSRHVFSGHAVVFQGILTLWIFIIKQWLNINNKFYMVIKEYGNILRLILYPFKKLSISI
jgi:hypothetical protein